MTFRVGQKVVCVDDSGHAALVMKAGEVFTVLCADSPSGTSIEIDCAPINDLPYSRFWGKCRFRPIVDKQTDISVFKEILHRVSRKQTERA